MSTKQTSPSPVESVVRRDDLERAWAAFGFMAMCGTLRGGKLGVVVEDFQSMGKYRRGEIVIYHDDGRTITVSKPQPTERLGSSGFIADYATMVNVPKRFVEPLDPRSPRIKETSR